MGKIWVDVCLISARGLKRSSSLWKLQWYAVGWIDPQNKYCTKIDSSGKANPVWKTRFSTAVDPSSFQDQELALHVEVYSREPIFLRESLLGSATILLKEFLDKYHSDDSHVVEEVGSFQLRKRNSNKPLGFVDVSIRISQEREEPASSYLGADEGFNLNDHGGCIIEGSGHGPLQPSKHPETSYSHYPPAGGARAPSYQPPRTPPPPPPPSSVGYIPNFFPMASNYAPSSYISMPSAVAPPARGLGSGFGMGIGAGALAAGAVIFGDDFMSAASRDASVSLSTYPPF